jgi:beta-lactam-binding protein with PASTA domain
VNGEVLGGRYRLEDRIGGGGMAWVWKAEDTLLHRPVAIKLLREEFVADEAFVRRFRQEAESAASLLHPNVVHVYDVGEEHGTHYIVMELVEGETLKARIQRLGPLPVGRALQIATSVARALQAAHRKGIIHRDIKPQNILLTTEGRVKVADFGIARAASGTTIVHTNTVIGSAHYFAPEQARGGFTDEKSDLYSLGAVLYEMLTGQPPFEGATPVAVALKHLQEEPVSPRRRRPEIPRSVDAIVLRLLEKDPAKRYTGADALLADLHRALEEIGEPMGEEEGTAPAEESKMRAARHTPPQPKKRRRIWPWVVIALALVLLIFGGIRAFSAWISVPNVKVANVEGLPLQQAKAKLTAQGLSVIVAGHEHRSAPKNTVVLQNPSPNDVVKKGRIVDLTISDGPQMVSVQDVVGQAVGQAEAMLQGFNVQVIQIKSDQPQGTVVKQKPQGGSKIAQGGKVLLSVSSGPSPTQATVPDLTGKTLKQSENVLGALPNGGVTVSQITYAYSTSESGTVLQQSIAPGTQVTQNMTITLTVSQGPPPPGGTGSLGGPEDITVTYAGQAAATLEVYLVDATGASVLMNATVQPSQQSPITGVTWYGDGRIEAYVNGNLVYSQALPVQGGAVTVQ